MLFPFSADGSVTVTTTMPDTITSWVASAFAVSSTTGIGVAPTTAKVHAYHQIIWLIHVCMSYMRYPRISQEL